MNKSHMESIDRLLEGTLPREEFDRLQEAMRNDPLLLSYYKEQAELNARLEWMLGDFQMAENVVEMHPPVRKWYQFSKSTAIAAALILAGGIGIGLMVDRYVAREPATVIADASEEAQIQEKEFGLPIVELGPVARVTNAKNAVFGNKEISMGSWLIPDQLELKSGRAQITMDSGAVVSMSAGAKVNIVDPHRIQLVSGQMIVQVPSSRREFICLVGDTLVSTEQGSYVLSSKAAGQDETLKIKNGLVTVSNPGFLADLTGGEGVVFGDGIKYLHEVEKPVTPEWDKVASEELHYIYWSFNEMQQASEDDEVTFTSESQWYDGDEFVLRKRILPDMMLTKEMHQSGGKYGKSLRLAGRGAYFESDFPGISGDKERTIACWVRTPTNPDLKNAYSIVSWGLRRSKDSKFQVSWNAGRDTSKGVKGALRVETGVSGHVIGETVINDGKWHHIACVVLPSSDPHEFGNIKLYVDGQLEKITGYSKMSINTDVESPEAEPLSIGLRLERINPRFRGLQHNNFKGRIDEFYIFDAALTPRQIKQLYLKNKPARRKAADTEQD
ncbi:hypothetical protein Rhal01_03569 [Rubritalea halochordaticola]|uniref:LamG-like jellyroll fold domain-containing protein n=1 Tax=Rubritalea halochordaticola TaxID=714537 RepID=A0ABP9V5W1_9BACT